MAIKAFTSLQLNMYRSHIAINAPTARPISKGMEFELVGAVRRTSTVGGGYYRRVRNIYTVIHCGPRNYGDKAL